MGRPVRLLLPFQSRVFESALTPAQALERLQAAVEPREWFRRRPSERPFEGTVEGTTFRIQRIIRSRNSFLPHLHGRVDSTPSGRARVVVAFRLHPVVAVFMAIWFGFLLMFGGTVLGNSPPSSGELNPRLLIPGMLAFGVVLVFGGFVPEAYRAERLLAEVLNARE